MEEIKIEEKKECCGDKKCCDDKKECCDDKKGGCDDKKCCFSACKHCPHAHKIVKLILAIIFVCALIKIGVVIGERRAERSNNFGRLEGRGMMNSRGDFRGNAKQGGRAMMQQGGFNQGGGRQALTVNGAQATCPMLERVQNQVQKVAPSVSATTTQSK